MKQPPGFSAYIVVTAAYWAFMLTDGALRMLVLLHFHMLGFSPVQLAYLFVFYEIAGVITNFSAGWIATRFGLASTLYAGLGLQVIALLALVQLDPSWSVTASVTFVMLIQGASGVAKDLTKVSSKSAIKILAPKDQSGLFRWVATLTGSKNAVKGSGFLLGAVLLAVFGFVPSVLTMALMLFGVLVAIVYCLPTGLPSGRKGVNIYQVFSTNDNINWLAASRLFLFGARDVWFVVGIPIYFYTVLSDGSLEGNRAAFFIIGAFMAAWTILYGVVQIWAPQILKVKLRSNTELIAQAKYWCASLFFVPAVLSLVIWSIPEPTQKLTLTIVFGLMLFGAIFAVNSCLHSFLILSFTEAKRVTMDVGFYYAANAAGRLIGTLASGFSYQIAGLPLCIAVAAGMIGLSWLGTLKLRGQNFCPNEN